MDGSNANLSSVSEAHPNPISNIEHRYNLSTVLLCFLYTFFLFLPFCIWLVMFFLPFFFFFICVYSSIPVLGSSDWVTWFSDRFSMFHIKNQLFSFWMKIFIRALLHNNYVNSMSCQSNHACANLILILFSHLTKL